jgi:hypothetical protein
VPEDQDDEHDSADALPAVPLDLLPSGLASVVEGHAESLKVTPEYTVGPTLAALGAALGPTWRTTASGWVVCAIDWHGLAAFSGGAKSPALRVGLGPLWAEHDRLGEAHALAVEALAAQPRSKGAPKPVAPPRRCVVATSATPQALTKLLADADGHGLLLASDELRELIGLAAGGTKGDRPAAGRCELLTLWPPGGRVALHRGRGGPQGCALEARCAALGIAGAVPTAALGASGLADPDGAFGRFLWVVAEAGERGLGRPVPLGIVARWARMVELAFASACPDADAMPWRPDALDLLDAAHRRWTREAAELGRLDLHLQASLLGKAGEHAHRLVALLHGAHALEAAAAEGVVARGPVGAETAEAGIALYERFYLPHCRRVAELVLARPEGAAVANERDRVVLAVLGRIVPEGESRTELAADWATAIVEAAGPVLSAESVGRAFGRLARAGAPGLELSRPPREADGKTWTVRRT